MTNIKHSIVGSCVALLSLYSSQVSHADFFIQVGSDSQRNTPIVVSSGQSVVIEVWGQATGNQFFPATVADYKLAFDLDTPGLGHNSQLTGMSADFSGGAITFITYSRYNEPASMVGHDFRAGASIDQFNGSVVDFSQPLKLFDIVIDTAASGVDATYSLSWVGNAVAKYNGVNANYATSFDNLGQFSHSVSSNAGTIQFTLTAVPEPSSILLASAALGCGAIYRRRAKTRKRSGEKTMQEF